MFEFIKTLNNYGLPRAVSFEMKQAIKHTYAIYDIGTIAALLKLEFNSNDQKATEEFF